MQFLLFFCTEPHRKFIPFGARGPRTGGRRKAFSCPVRKQNIFRQYRNGRNKEMGNFRKEDYEVSRSRGRNEKSTGKNRSWKSNGNKSEKSRSEKNGSGMRNKRNSTGVSEGSRTGSEAGKFRGEGSKGRSEAVKFRSESSRSEAGKFRSESSRSEAGKFGSESSRNEAGKFGGESSRVRKDRNESGERRNADGRSRSGKTGGRNERSSGNGSRRRNQNFSGKSSRSFASAEAEIAAATARVEAEEAEEALAAQEEETEEAPAFDTLEIDERILRATKEMGFEQMSPIQAQAIPVMLEGSDMIGQAQTGTGKTAAFGIPVLQKTDSHDKSLQAVVLCPTRELAVQVADEIRKLAKFMHGVKVLPVYGGQEIRTQIRSLKAGVQIVVGTPGRVMDHMRRGTIDLKTIHTIILDEADEMLDMGFVEDIETILSATPEVHQTVLFSATMPKPIMDIARKFQKDARLIRVVRKELTVPKIEQYYYEVVPGQKTEVLCRLLDMYNPKLSLIFCNTKSRVDSLTDDLKGRGYFAGGLHGDLNQVQRDRVMNSFRKGNTNILVATDVAARGIDVDDIEAVFNYDLPQDDEYYVHRIGRTGRAGRNGIAFTFISGKEVYKLRDIQIYCKTKIKARAIPSENEVAKIKAEKILDQVDEIIEKDSLKDMIDIIEEQINDKDYTALDVAAAFLKKYMGETEEKEAFSEDDFSDTGAEEEGMVRLFINVGKESRVRPGDIVGAIAGETGIDGKLIGKIDMFDKFTFVEIPKENAREVLSRMKDVKIRGKNIVLEPASARNRPDGQ
jgi:ATP-dependent RNA helicase DeaD